MKAHGSAMLACDAEESARGKRELTSLVIVRDVQYRPKRWSIEVERVCEATLDALPSGTAPPTARWLKAVAPHL